MDPQVAEMSRALFLLTQRRTADSKVFGSQHAVIKELGAQIDTISAELARLRAEKLQERRADMRQAVNTAYENTRHALFIAQESLLKAEAALQDQDRLLFDYFNRRAEIGEKVEYRRQLSEYINNLSRIKARRTAINVNVAQPAIEALKRSSPSVLLLPLGVFLALALSVGLALGLELLDTSVRTSQDMVRHLDVSLLGLIPHTDDEEVAIKQVERAVAEAPRSMVAEAFRQIRTNLQFCASAERQRTILIASPRPNDGKTTVACNLAMSLAQAGRRVLLVDANLRRPSLERIFEQVNPKGLSNLLTGEGSLESFVLKSVVPRLDVLGAGPPPPNPGELLGGAPCRAFLKEAAAQYDQVIVDTSPVLLTSDALVLAPAADGVVLVVRANRNSRGVARRARNLLTDVGARLFGGVLNAAQVARGGYFREQLRDYYEYQTEPSGRPAQPVSPQRPTPPPTDA